MSPADHDQSETHLIREDTYAALELGFPPEWGIAERAAARAAYTASFTPEQQELRRNLQEKVQAELGATGFGYPKDMNLFPDNDGLTPKKKGENGMWTGNSLIEVIEDARRIAQQPFFQWSKTLSKEAPPQSDNPIDQAKLDYPRLSNKYYERLPNKQTMTALRSVMHGIDETENVTSRIVRDNAQMFISDVDVAAGGSAKQKALRNYKNSDQGKEMLADIQHNVADVGMVYYVMSNYGEDMRQDLRDYISLRQMNPSADHNSTALMQGAMRDYDENPTPGISLREAMRRAEDSVGSNLDVLKHYHDRQVVAAKIMSNPASGNIEDKWVKVSIQEALDARNSLMPGNADNSSCMVDKIGAAQYLAQNNKGAPGYAQQQRNYSELQRCSRLNLTTMPADLHDQRMTQPKQEQQSTSIFQRLRNALPGSN